MHMTVCTVYNAGLRLVEHKFDLVRCPFRDEYIAKKGDPVKHAKVGPLCVCRVSCVFCFRVSCS